MTIIDITQPLRPGMPVWPGDRAFEPAWSARRSDGASVNVGAVAMSLHTGTHADAPLHIEDEGRSIAEMGLTQYVGPAVVVEWMGEGEIPASVLDDLPERASTILFKTRPTAPPEEWDPSFAHLSVDLARRMVREKVELVGLDTPSVDHPDSKDLPVHHILFDGGLANLENLRLEHVRPGRYWMMALPVMIEGMDAGPVRAALIPEDDLRQSLM